MCKEVVLNALRAGSKGARQQEERDSPAPTKGVTPYIRPLRQEVGKYAMRKSTERPVRATEDIKKRAGVALPIKCPNLETLQAKPLWAFRISERFLAKGPEPLVSIRTPARTNMGRPLLP